MRALQHVVRLVVLAMCGALLVCVVSPPSAGAGPAAVRAADGVGTAPAPEADSVIEGRVYDEGGQALDGMLVEALAVADPGGDPVASDLTYEYGDVGSHGAYRLHVPAGDYLVRFSSPDKATAVVYETVLHGGGAGTSVSASPDEPRLLPDVTMYRDTGVPVTGVVRDPSGAGIGGLEVALVRSFRNGDASWLDYQVTDQAGRYTFEAVNRNRTYTVQVHGESDVRGVPLDYPSMFLGGAPVAALAKTFSLPSGSAGTELEPIDLVAGTPVGGTVRGPQGETPSRMDVYAYVMTPNGPEQYRSRFVGHSADGSFSIAVPPEYEYTVGVDPYAAWSDSRTYLGDTLVIEQARSIAVGTEPVDVGTIRVGHNATMISVEVLDSEGDPVRDGDVRVALLERSEDGRFSHARDLYDRRGNGRFEGRAAQGSTYTIRVRDYEGGTTAYLGGADSPEKATPITPTAGQDALDVGSITLDASRVKLRGTVVEGGGAPIAQARATLYGVREDCVACWNELVTVETDEAGRYVLPVHGWAADQYDYVTVGASLDDLGYLPGYLGSDDRAGATRIATPSATTDLDDLTLRLTDGVLQGELRHADGSPATGDAYAELYRWRAQWDGTGFFEYVGFVNVTGSRYAFRSVGQGTYVVIASTWEADGRLRGGTAGPFVPSERSVLGAFEVAGDATRTTAPPIELQETYSVSGALTTDDGQPIDGEVGIQLLHWRPGAEGAGKFERVWQWSQLHGDRYTVHELPPGSYAVSAVVHRSGGPSRYGRSWYQGQRPTSVESDGVLTISDADTTGVDIDLQVRRGISGSVFQEPAGPDAEPLPVEGAEVRLWAAQAECDECAALLDTVTTAADGSYSFDHEEWYDSFRGFTVSAEALDNGLTLRYVGDVTFWSEATAVDSVDEGTTFDRITLAPAENVLRGRLTTVDDLPLDGSTVVKLFRWNDDVQEFELWSSMETRSARYAFRHVAPGRYALRADYTPDGRHDYLASWLGGEQPASGDAEGVVTVADDSSLTQVGDLELVRGLAVTGTVTSPAGTPLVGVDVHGTSRLDGESYYSGSTTDDDGRYELRVPAGGALHVVAVRQGLEDYTRGADREPAVPIGAEDTVLNFTMRPAWGNVGQVAGERLDHCLTSTRGRIPFAGLELDVRRGHLIRSDAPPRDNPFARYAEVGVLAPLLSDEAETMPTWGISPDGNNLCVQWGMEGHGSVYQALLQRSPDGGFDVVYNYDTIPRTSSTIAGYTDGYGEHGSTAVFDGGAAGGYEDASPNGLVHHSVGSTQRGRYAFHFDGFHDRGAAPELEEAPSIDGERAVGATLTADGGRWSVDGQPAEVELSYRWYRGRTTLGRGSTYVVRGDDFGERVHLAVKAFVPYRHLGRGLASARVKRGVPAASVDAHPTLSPATAAIGGTITLDPGTWQAAPDLAPADLSIAYQWFRDGRRVAVHGTEYPVTEADEESTIGARVVISAPDHGTVVTPTVPVRVAARPVLRPVDQPSIEGQPKVGEPLVVDPGTWEAPGATFTYTWYVGWRQEPADAGSGGKTFTPSSSDGQNHVAVVVTASAPGFRDGSWTTSVGPVLDQDATLTELTVHVRDHVSERPVPGLRVWACETDGWSCLPSGRTDADGNFTGSAVAGATYEIGVQADADRGYKEARTVERLAIEGSTTVDIAVAKPTEPPKNVTIPTSTGTSDGTTPSVYWQEPQRFEVTGCANVVDPRYTVRFSDGTPERTAPLTASPASAGLVTYTATIPAFYPSHGDTVISTNVPADCEPDTELTVVNIYIDPSGIVTDQYGRPIDGATVTLLRSETAAGVFTEVPARSEIMSEANRKNPDTTDSTGFFRWDVVEGFYRVRAAASGCTTATTDPMAVLPARVDLLIKLSCDRAAPSAKPTVVGDPRVGATLEVTAGAWGELSRLQHQWLRDGAVIDGATGGTYRVTSEDVGRKLSVRETAQRPTYVQEEGRGSSVTFAPAMATSDGMAIEDVVVGDAPTATKPVIAGTPKVGSTLSVADPVWSREGVSTSRQWLVDGKAVEGATGKSFVVRAGDSGKAVSVEFTGRQAGYADGSVVTEPVIVVAADTPPGGGGSGGGGGGSTGAAPTADKPVITGSPKVGSTLSVADPAWSRSGVVTSRQWLVDGQAVAGATGSGLELRPSDLGRTVSVKFTGTQAGYADGSVTTAGVTVGKGDAPTAEAPAVVGNRKVGSTLSVADPIWSREGVATSRQWMVGGKPVTDAADSTYVVRPGDLGKAVAVVFTGLLEGYEDASLNTVQVLVLAGDGATASSAPRITGEPEVGRVLHASRGTWDVEGLTFTYQWLRDGSPIGEVTTARTYRVRRTDIGKALSVRVVASRAGYADGVADSAAITIGKLRSTVTAKLSTRKARAGERVILTGLVEVEHLARPAGKVKILDGTQVLGVLRLAPRAEGAFRAKLLGLGAGKHVLSARYSGTATTAAATSEAVTLTVGRPARPVGAGSFRHDW